MPYLKDRWCQFDGAMGSVFVDICHPTGNQQVAMAMSLQLE